jgi:hypothetical protein
VSGWTGLAPVMARIAASAAIAGGLVAAVLRATRRRQPRPVAAAWPRRRTAEELAAVLGQAATRPWSRDLAAEMLRRLARDAVASRLGVDDRTAREIIETGAWDADPRLAGFLATDWLDRSRAAKPAGDFIGDYRMALDLLEEWSQGEPRRKA